MKTHPILIALLAAVAGSTLIGCASRTVYFSGSHSGILRAPVNGGKTEVVTPVPAMVAGLAYSPKDGVLYTAQQVYIRKWGVKGEVLGMVIETKTANCVAVDGAHGRIYWGDQAAQQVASCDLQGQDKRVLVSGVDYPEAVAVSPANGWLFWSRESGLKRGVRRPQGERSGSLRGVWRARLDGSEARQLTHEGGLVLGIAVEERTGCLYWVRPGYNLVGETQIMVADFDGKGSRPLVQGLDHVSDLVVDGGWLYWPERSAKGAAIRRMKTDGSGLETVARVDAPDGARSLTVGPAPRKQPANP